jgi:3-deoxy-7-phosphoheptulonate synthase
MMAADADRDAAAEDLLERIDDLRIASIRPLMPAACLVEEVADSSVYETIRGARGALSSIARGRDPRLAVVVGPAAAHDPAAVLEFAKRLQPVAESLRDELVLVVRVFLDEPAGGAGRWSGAMYDPGLDGSFQVNRGFRQARTLLLEIARLGLPAGCLYLDSISPQFVADLVSWSAIGSPTVSSALHRQLASGLSTPVGFCGAAGAAAAAADAVRAASAAHAFLSVSKQGVAGVVQTTGNRDTHVVLPGAAGGAEAEAACAALAALNLPSRVMVDCGYGAGQETPAAMAEAAAAVASRVAAGDDRVSGVLLSSFLEEGQQNIGHDPSKLRFGVSVTEPCLGWDQTVATLRSLAEAVKQRRAAAAAPALGRAPSLTVAARSFRELGALDTTDNLRVKMIRPLLSPACAIEQVRGREGAVGGEERERRGLSDKKVGKGVKGLCGRVGGDGPPA